MEEAQERKRRKIRKLFVFFIDYKFRFHFQLFELLLFSNSQDILEDLKKFLKEERL